MTTTLITIPAQLMIADAQYHSEREVSVEGVILSADGSSLIAKDTLHFPRETTDFAPEFLKRFGAQAKTEGVKVPGRDPGSPSTNKFSPAKKKRK